MTQSPSFPYIAMAAPVYANPRSFVGLSGLPHAADELFNQMLRIFADSVGPCAMNPPFHHLASLSPRHHNPGTTLRTPKLSILGFASLLLGISSTLMLLGSLAFFLGFMLMPLIVPASIVGASLAAFKEGRQPTAASSKSLQSRKIFDTKAWF